MNLIDREKLLIATGNMNTLTIHQKKLVVQTIYLQDVWSEEDIVMPEPTVGDDDLDTIIDTVLTSLIEIGVSTLSTTEVQYTRQKLRPIVLNIMEVDD